MSVHDACQRHSNRRLNDTSINDTEEVRSSIYGDFQCDPMGPVNLNWEKLPKIYVVACTTIYGSHLKGHAGIPRIQSIVPVRDALIHVKSRLNKCCWTEKVVCTKEDWNEHYGVNTKKRGRIEDAAGIDKEYAINSQLRDRSSKLFN